MNRKDWNYIFNKALRQTKYSYGDEETPELYASCVKHMDTTILNIVTCKYRSKNRDWNTEFINAAINEITVRALLDG